MIWTWTRALAHRQPARLLGPAAGVAIAVALLATLGLFVASSKASMTARATSGVAIDWQVQVQPDADPTAVAQAVSDASGTTAAQPVAFAVVPGFRATVSGTTQTTGPGVVLGLPDRYRQEFPTVLRTLSGADTGVLVAQQTAANLHVAPGNSITVLNEGKPLDLHVDGVVDMPTADSLFQKVGAPPGAQPSAPPDNVLLIPQAVFDRNFPAADGSATSWLQVHARRSHALPPDPAAAYAVESSSARNLEATTSGGGLVGDNLGATLDAARSDSLYAQMLFLFLGAPWALLAGLLTAVIAGAATGTRRREQAALRTRGASRRQLTNLIGAEAVVVVALGAIIGLVAGVLIGRGALGFSASSVPRTDALVWIGIAFAVAATITGLTLVAPARRDLGNETVTDTSRSVDRGERPPRWARYGVDLILLAAAVLVFRMTSRAGYALVLAPEGVPSISVNYWAFLGPALLWAGTGLLIWRLVDLGLRRGRRPLAAIARPITGPLAGTVAAVLSRQRRTVAHAVVLLALALSFAISTASFNATYRQQAEVDAQLTNGADVTVTFPPGTNMSPTQRAWYRAIDGVRAVEPIQHRYAYVGADLQDIYGVNPATITQATGLQDAYFAGGTATSLMTALANQPDGVLVSDETVRDFQLAPGDRLNLRLAKPGTPDLVTIPFHYIGVAREFPTAPSDSFLVANATYLATMTGSNDVGAFLIDTNGANIPTVAAAAQQVAGPAGVVTDITATRGRVGSSLTSVDLSGLTRVELAFALLLAAASGGLVLWLGLAERRRTFAIVGLLGASRANLTGFVTTEALIVLVCGALGGIAGGWALTSMLVGVLTGVFDPPPATIDYPWPYLLTLAVATTAAVAVAAAAATRSARRADVSILRTP